MRIYTYKQGSNQFRKVPKSRAPEICAAIAVTVYAIAIIGWAKPIHADKNTQFLKQFEFGTFAPLAVAAEPKIAGMSAEALKPATLPNIVAYIAEKWEKHGTGEVVKAINCFYSESGLRPTATNTNTDSHKSTDHGIAQLNDYWHKLTEQEKTNFIANIDRAYVIYKGRGNSFSAWYGKRCN